MPLRPLAISLGDPAGIGPEVTARALGLRRPRGGALLVGDPASVPMALRARLKGLPWVTVRKAGWRPGRPSAASGDLAHASVVEAVRSVQLGEARGLVTAPLSKEALHLAGRRFAGHTELLAELCGLKPNQVGMLLVGGGLRVFLVSRHVSLRQALDGLTRRSLDQALALCASGLRQTFGLKRPRIALAALNPHAGEAGAFGREEQRLLKPWTRARARRRDCRLSGPWPADTLFVQAARGAYDAVLCLYHDQGLIPLKLLAFDSGVNVTLGLPFVRSSPDHGTAFDLAGKGKADPGSMAAALALADRLAAA
jgi:4-hydroxythreonine-4-phosphate dehydrogenase